MKLTSKNRAHFIRLLVLGMIIGTLSWAIIERLLNLAGLPIDLSIGPVGVDAYIVSLFFRVNPGTAAGSLLGWRLFVSA